MSVISKNRIWDLMMVIAVLSILSAAAVHFNESRPSKRTDRAFNAPPPASFTPVTTQQPK